MESELRPLETTNRIDDSISEPDQDLQQEPEPDVYHHMMYPPPTPPRPMEMPQQHRQTGGMFDDGGDKLFYIVLFVSFILGFFMGKTMQPIVIRST